MNEWLFISIVVLELFVVLLASRWGKEWLYATIIANVILSNVFASKLVEMFGVVTNASNAFYAAIFIATDILAEHYGKRDAYRSVWLAFIGLLLFTVMGQFILEFEPIPPRENISDGMDTVFGVLPQVAGAGFLAYVLSQNFDVWCFHKLKMFFKGRHLWLRNNVSTLISQFIDSVVFFGLAFIGTVTGSTMISLILTGWLVKLCIALVDTPVIYLSYLIRGQPMPDFSRSVRESVSGRNESG